MNDILWKPVVGYEDLYAVSSTGLVKRTAEGPATFAGRILKPALTRGGYLTVRLYRNGVGTGRTIHRLVAFAFIGPEPEGCEVCHNDGNPANNDVANLRWDTRSSNTLDTVKHGTNYLASKTHCPQGHPYDDSNTGYTPSGHGSSGRICKECKRVRAVEIRRASGIMPRTRPTHCPHGHEFTPENTYQPPGARSPYCRACRKANSDKQNARRNAERSARLRLDRERAMAQARG